MAGEEVRECAQGEGRHQGRPRRHLPPHGELVLRAESWLEAGWKLAGSWLEAGWFHTETLMIYKLGSRKSTSQNDLYESY